MQSAAEVEDVTNTLTHDELLEVTKSTVCTLLSCDPLLSDLPTDIILEEILAQSKSSSQPINIFKDADEPNLSTFYSQAIFDDPLLCCSQDDMNAYMKYQNECLNRDQDNSPPKASKRSKETSKKTGTSKNKSPNNELNS